MKEKDEVTKRAEKLDLVIAIINRGFADLVLDASRSAGANGATIMYGRSGIKKDEQINGINLQSDKEVVLILVKHSIRKNVMQEICDQTNLYEKGNGVCFALPVNKVKGIPFFENAKKKAKTKSDQI